MRLDKLTQKQRKILSYIHLNASATYDEIARACETKSHIARSEVEKLCKAKVITPCVVANYAGIGLLRHHIYVTIYPLDRRARQEFISSVVAHPRIAWACDFTGKFDFGFSFLAKNALDFDTEFRKFLSQYKNIIKSKTVSIDVSWTYYGKKYLFNDRSFLKPIRISLSETYTKIDSIDRSVLKILSLDAFTPMQLIANKMTMPLSTVHSRIQSMKEKKIISGYVQWISYSKLNIFAYRVLIEFGGLTDAERKRIEEHCAIQPYIVSLIFTSGAWDVELGVDLEDRYHIHDVVADIKSLASSQTFNVTILQRHDDLKWNTICPGVFE